jgi:Mlc titration factor MtfA (ptsG expression regulator)
MIFNWLKQRRRAKILATPFPENWNQTIRDNVRHACLLTSEQQQKLCRLVRIFVAEKNWEGCGGLILTDEMKVTIAAQACLLVVGMNEDWLFEHVLSILVYATGYVAPESHVSGTGLVMDAVQPRLGEAWWRGPVILSWADSLAGGRMESPGRNLVLHEFAHQLDMMNGRICDGTPPLKTRELHDRWVSVLGPVFDQLVKDCRSGRRGRIDCYGAKNPAEFFAVMTEAFFEHPGALRHHYEEAYSILRDFYGLDPAEWNTDTLK